MAEEKKTLGFFTVNTSEGSQWEGTPYELDETEMREVAHLCQSITKLSYLSIPFTDGLGRKAQMYFNPAHVVAVRFTVIS